MKHQLKAATLGLMGLFLVLCSCGYESQVLTTRLSLEGTLDDGSPNEPFVPNPDPDPDPKPDPQPSNCKQMSSQECRLFELVNEERVKNNLPAFKEHSVCALAAREHAVDMNTYKYLSSDGRNETWLERMIRWGLIEGAIAQNIGRNLTADAMFAAWMGVQGQKNNLLSNRYFSTGIGKSGEYWVQCFTSQIE